MKTFTTAVIRGLLNQVYREEISFSRMVEVINQRISEPEVREFKDGDFVYEDGRIMIFKSYPNNYHYIYYPLIGKHAFNDNYGIDFTAKSFRRATEEEKQVLLDALAKEGKRWNEEKKCVEDIPVRKFKIGDKVRIKEGVSSKTHGTEFPWFNEYMDELIGTTMTVNKYTAVEGHVVCNGSDWRFHEDWLEPYEELKEGDLAIFWQFDKTRAVVRLFDNVRGDVFQNTVYVDNTSNWWANAIKFESIEQYRKLLKGEI